LFHYVPLFGAYVIFFRVIKLPATVPLLFIVASIATIVGLAGTMYLCMGLKLLLKSKSRLILGKVA
jgi:hypothetical protein